MNTSTLPLVAVDLFDDGRPWFPFSVHPGTPVMFDSAPLLRVDTWQWVEGGPAADGHATVTLTEAVLTELLYTSSLPPTAHPTREALLEVVRTRLCAYGCDVRPRPEHDSVARLACCATWLAELRGGATS